MTRSRLLLIGLVLAAGAAAGWREPRTVSAMQEAPPGSRYEGRAFTFNKIADGIHLAIGTGALIVMSNAAIVEGDRDVLVVDSHVTPGGAWALRKELAEITTKPIRYVVNSHYHFDHSHGNQIYGPGVEIIGHQFTREMILAGKSIDSPAYEFSVGGVLTTIKTLDERLTTAADEKTRAQTQTQLAVQRNLLEGTKVVTPTPPNLTITQSMTLHLGSREVRLLHLGRGHTAGDVVVYLPRERIVATGDLLTEQTSYMGDAYVADWIQTIETLKGLDFDTVLPGHGRAFTGKVKLDHWQAYLRDFWAQAQKFHKAGVPWEDAAKQVDLRGNAVNYPGIKAPGITPNHGMRRAYEILDGRVK